MAEGSYLEISPSVSLPYSELVYRTSRSGGPGGQNVNKLETRVEILFDVVNSSGLTQSQRTLICESLKNRMDSDGILRVVSQESRSQYQNKEFATRRLVTLLRKALTPPKKRLKTKPSRSSAAKRLESKRRHSEKKRLRSSHTE